MSSGARWLVTVILTLSALSIPAFPSSRSRRRAESRNAYREAVRLQARLDAKPERTRRKSDYIRVIHAFRQVYWLDPAYQKAPIAIEAVGDLYDEMGRVFSSDRYYMDAVSKYRFLVSQYPLSSMARSALFKIGEIYRNEIENPEEASKAFREFLKRYPRSAKSAEARKALREVTLASKSRGRTQAESGRPATKTHRRAHMADITDIRRWVGPDYSRIVIGLDREAKFDTTRLAHPDRIVLDLFDTRLSPRLSGRQFKLADGFLHQIRVAQYNPKTARVVLDVKKKIGEYSVFTLPNPYRLIVDIHGQQSEEARGQHPISKPPAPARRSIAEIATAPKIVNRATHEALHFSRTNRSPPEVEAKERVASSAPTGPTHQGPVIVEREESPQSSDHSSRIKRRTKENSAAKAAPRTTVTTVQPAIVHGPPTLTRALGLKIRRIVIDPGHGGHDTGTIGPTGLEEKNVVLDVALRLRKLLEERAGCTVIMTRTNDTFVPLEERTAIANASRADLFISIHANASRDHSARGIETYYLNFTSDPEALEIAARENATSRESVYQLHNIIKKIALTEKIAESQEFAKIVDRTVHHVLAKDGSPQPDRGVKRAPFVVLIGARMPSILTEISFLSNPHDERMLRRPAYREEIAEALYQGIVRYMDTLGELKVAERASGSAAQGDPPHH